MDNKNKNVYMFQKNLDVDKDLQTSFISAEAESESETCKIVLPRRSRKRGTDTCQELLHQLIDQQAVLAKTQKKMYELRAEIDKEEVVTRYLKLDLNNSIVNLGETKENLCQTKTELFYARSENWAVRVGFTAYILFYIYSFLVGQFTLK